MLGHVRELPPSERLKSATVLRAEETAAPDPWHLNGLICAATARAATHPPLLTPSVASAAYISTGAICSSRSTPKLLAALFSCTRTHQQASYGHDWPTPCAVSDGGAR